MTTEDRKRIARWQIVIVGLAILSKLCLAGDWYGFAATLSFVSKDLNMTAGQAGLSQGAIAITYGLGMLFWSPLSRRFSGESFVAIGLAITGIAMLAQAFIHDMIALVTLRLVIGFFEAGVWVGAIKLIFGWFPPARRGLVMGLVLAAYSLAITIDFSVGIPVAAAFGWRYFFAGLGLFTMVSAGIAAMLGRPGPAALGISGFDAAPAVPSAASHAPLSILFKAKWLYIGGFAIFGDTFALAATATWVVPAFVDRQHMPVGMGAAIGAAMGLSQVVFLTIGGYLSDRMSRLGVIQIGAALAALSAILFTTATVWAMPFPLLLAITGLSGVAVFSGGAIFSLLGEKYPAVLGPAATGYAEVFGMVSTFTAPAAMGLAIDLTQSFFVAFMVFTVAELAIVALTFALSREPRRAASPVEALEAAG